MFKPIPVAIGLRYLRAKRRNGFISFISMASILGIALGVTVLITTLAVMSGFQKEIRDRLLQMAAHATVSAEGAPMQDWRHAVEVASADPRIAGAAPYIETESLLQGPRKQPAIVRGVIPSEEAKVSVLAKKMQQGSVDSLTPGSYNIVIGKELALWLGVDVGDSIVVLLSDTQATPLGAMPRLKRFTVSGIFEAGYNEIDRGLAVVNMEDLARVLRMDGVTGVRLRLYDMDQAFTVARDLALKLRGPFRVSDWTQENANLYHSLKMEKTVMGILLSLIVAMGAFNLVSSQVMLVTDKQADIAILRTLGLSPGGVMQVFMVQGSLIGFMGTIMGVIGGIVLTLNLERILGAIEAVFSVKLLPEDVYYITGLPTDMQTQDVVVITVVALVMSFLATLYPAWRASRTQPAEALRYE
ncbi:lipoprotein-releasing ABC transporter permease subunit [Xanthomonas campestris pv. campestris]|jgi:lipoprotein-releasing system permease protein|uniref:lipoprotein-releasing ABC transporter permease subunit n=1 Tax=Xanthomonas campestris TaxID=339 RepID=UPI0003064846|nr:lipoprotein-releasing ABC transporter permease subunit [Xanthomonas campestris]MCC5046472.1 lipoprotein-releasing ABC transporter permease subunit [Xanthomonas campestris]MCC5050660.1 lipoprotein-releasing ABC transporter permease subunit [Xanthomonas campestris pv. aberrans]MCC5054955.1 lipoprotein-releasing ABC transporter permease subunit [Xanthomonas campestris]MCC5059034.1 lipoprotein-releasing ABC transporter permease subunit [Xanthomonas campestris]MCF8810047.1 lipoprotein-releasing 